MQFVYPAHLSPSAPDEVVVSFRDLPECLTSGVDASEALAAASDALAEALAGRIDDGESIPAPSRAEPGEYRVPVPLGMAVKAALAIAFRDSGLTRVAFAALLGVDEKAVRRMLDPRHAASLRSMDNALGRLGCRVAVEATPTRGTAEQRLPDRHEGRRRRVRSTAQ